MSQLFLFRVKIQVEFVEEGEIHFVAHGTSLLSDQLPIVPGRVAELEGFTGPVRTENGIQVVDTMRFLKETSLLLNLSQACLVYVRVVLSLTLSQVSPKVKKDLFQFTLKQHKNGFTLSYTHLYTQGIH